MQVAWRGVLLLAVAVIVVSGIFGDGRVALNGDTVVMTFSSRYGRLTIMHADFARRLMDIDDVSFGSRNGTVAVTFKDQGRFTTPFDVPSPSLVSRSLGFRYQSLQIRTTELRQVAVPQWILVIAAVGLVSVSSIVRYVRRASRYKRGQCVNCGYDLRSSPDQCPECGRGQVHLTAVVRENGKRDRSNIGIGPVPLSGLSRFPVSGDGYTVGFSPNATTVPGQQADELTLTLKQAAASTLGDSTDSDGQWNAQSKTLTISRPASGTKTVDFDLTVKVGGINQKNVTFAHEFTQEPPPPAFSPDVAGDTGTGQDGVMDISIGITPQTTPGTYKIKWTSPFDPTVPSIEITIIVQ